jgi:uncharacterized membrane protein YGL010W
MTKYYILALIFSLIAHSIITNKKSTFIDDLIGAVLYTIAVVLVFVEGGIYG